MSGTHDMTFVDPAAVWDAAVEMAALAEAHKRRWNDRRALIERLHEQKPWTHDAVGQAFERSYLGRAGGVSAQDTLDNMTTLLDDVCHTSEAAGTSARATEEDDEVTADLFRGRPGASTRP